MQILNLVRCSWKARCVAPLAYIILYSDQWHQRLMAGEAGGNYTPYLNFWQSENILLDGKFASKMQNLGLKNHFGKI